MFSSSQEAIFGGARGEPPASGPPELRTLRQPELVARLLAVFGLSRSLGLAREIAVAVLFGTTVVADRLNIAFVVASVAATIVGEAVYTTCVRRLGGVWAEGTWPESYRQLFPVVLRIGVFAGGMFLVLGPMVALAVVGSQDWSGVRQTILLCLLLAPSVLGYTVCAGINARLTLEGRVVLLNGAQVLYSLSAVIVVVLAHLATPAIEAEALAAGWSLGNLASAGALYLVAGPRHAPGPSPEARARVSPLGVLAYGAPLAVAYALLGAQAITGRAVATRLEAGAAAALGYADRLFLLPVGFFVTGLAPLVLGSMTRARVLGDTELGALARGQLTFLASLLVPVSLLFCGLVPWLVATLFEYGAFSASSSRITIAAADGLCVSLAATSLVFVLIRAMQVVLPLRRLVALTGVGLIFNALLSVAGAIAFGIIGITLATAIVALGSALAQIRWLGDRFGVEWANRTLMGIGARLALVSGVVALIVALYQGDVIGAAERFAVSVGLAFLSAVALFLQSRWRGAADSN